MFEQLESQQRLTRNQRVIILVTIIAGVLEFFDYFLIGFVLPLITKTWKLTFLEGAIILLSSGVGGILGAYFCGYLADKIGRRPMFIATVCIFSLSTGLMALTPENSWLFLTICRIGVGLGFGGLYAVDMTLVQEYVPTSRRGFITGLATVFVPIGVVLGGLLGASLSPLIGWRGLFVIGLLPALLALPVRSWIPESPRWLLRHGKLEEARRSLAWALQIPPEEVRLPAPDSALPVERTKWTELFQHPRSLLLSWLGNLGMQTGAYGIVLWYPTLLLIILKLHDKTTTPVQALYLSVWVSLGGLAGRLLFSYLSERLGRRPSSVIVLLGSALLVVLTAMNARVFWGSVPVFLLLLIAGNIFIDGGFAVIGPYAAEVWPTRLRASGLGSAYGFGGVGKIIGPLGLALIVGASNPINPQASLGGILPAFVFLAAFYLFGALVYGLLGFETKGRSIEEIDKQMTPGPGDTQRHGVLPQQ